MVNSSPISRVWFQCLHPVRACVMDIRKHNKRVWLCCVMKVIDHSMGTAFLFKCWQQAVRNGEKNIPLCASSLPCPAKIILVRCGLDWNAYVIKISENVEYDNEVPVLQVSVNTTLPLAMPNANSSIRRIFTKFVISGFSSQHVCQSSDKVALTWMEATHDFSHDHAKLASTTLEAS